LEQVKASWDNHKLWRDTAYRKFAEQLTSGAHDNDIIRPPYKVIKDGRAQTIEVEPTKLSKNVFVYGK
jgi:hypothetical protein